jgi:hypothetical protein
VAILFLMNVLVERVRCVDMRKKKQYDKVKSVKRMSRNVVGQPKPTTRMKSKKDKKLGRLNEEDVSCE